MLLHKKKRRKKWQEYESGNCFDTLRQLIFECFSIRVSNAFKVYRRGFIRKIDLTCFHTLEIAKIQLW